MIYAAVLRKNVVYGIENETTDSCADKDLSYGKVVELMDDMKLAGAASISIATVNK